MHERRYPPPRLELRGITKQFPGVLANDHVDFTVEPGEIHALLGENGAGKSTLVKIIYGVMQPDEGEILWRRPAASHPNPHAARRLGIGMVFQHFSLFEAMTVLENIALGIDGRPPTAACASAIGEVAERLRPAARSRPRASTTLSVGERQRIEIVRCLLQDPRLLIMDEPTSVLTPQEVERAVRDPAAARRARAARSSTSATSCDEIGALCDGATILRGGKVVAQCDPRRDARAALAEMMIGGRARSASRDAGGRRRRRRSGSPSRA